MPAPSTSTGWDFTVLAFLIGFAVATLVFWPMLHRVYEQKRAYGQKRSQEHKQAHETQAREPNTVPIRRIDSGQRTGKHALGKPAPRRANPPHTATAALQQNADSQGRKDTSESGASAIEAPQDLFEQQHGPKFDHFRTRLARLRKELENHS